MTGFAVLCPGQGAQHPGMFDRIAGELAADAVLADATSALGGDPRSSFAPGGNPFRNAVAQPLVCIAQLAQWRALAGRLPAPTAFAGYSVGELACYGLAGALDAGALARVARERARCMDTAAVASSALVAVRGLARARVAALCEGLEAWIAIAVSSEAQVVGGTRPALDAFAARLATTGGHVAPLAVDVAAHTPLLAAAATSWRPTLEREMRADPAWPVVAGIDGSRVTTRARAVDALCSQLAQTVEWARCVDALLERGVRVFLELGPGRALSRGIAERHDDVEVRAVEDFASLAAAADWVRQRLDAH